MSKRYEKTLKEIFTNPVKANIKWNDIITMFNAMGYTVEQKGGSVVSVDKDGLTGVFHAPHPQNEAYKSIIRRIRKYLKDTGINY